MKYMLGYCMEYNVKGQRIQNNYYRNCLVLNPPCTTRYKSTEAYKYQSCYKAEKKNSFNSSKLSDTTLMPAITTKSTKDKNHNEKQQNGWIIVLTTSIVFFGILAAVVIGYIKWRRKKWKIYKMRMF
ncbi:uncharacterized protein LOC134280753 [Saccostrea cucullata]